MTDQTIDDELEVLNSIYDQCLQSFSAGDKCTLLLNFLPIDEKPFTIEVSFSSSLYPADHSSIEIALKSSSYYIDSSFSSSILHRISSENPGGCIMFQLLEEIKEYVTSQQELLQPLATNATSSNNYEEEEEEIEMDPVEIHRRIIERERLASQGNNGLCLSNGKTVRIIHGPVIMEQKSTFQAHIAQVTSMEEVDFVRYSLLLDKKVASATHNIMAYRFTDPNTSIVHHDYDDDGECAAGGRLAEMVRLMGATNMIVVVSRWFGGILLGPSRFKYICNTARDLLEQHNFCRDDKKSKNHR